MTPYALFGLIQAEDAGYPCPNPHTIERGLARLRMYLEQMGSAWVEAFNRPGNARYHEINDSLFCLWVYSLRAGVDGAPAPQAGRPPMFTPGADDMTAWWPRIENGLGSERMSDYGHALALELAVKFKKKDLADKLAAELHKRAK